MASPNACVSPASLGRGGPNHDRQYSDVTHFFDLDQAHPVPSPDAGVDSRVPSPYSSQPQSDTSLPTSASNTPAESASTLGISQPSNCNDYDGGFFNVDVNDSQDFNTTAVDELLFNVHSLDLISAAFSQTNDDITGVLKGQAAKEEFYFDPGPNTQSLGNFAEHPSIIPSPMTSPNVSGALPLDSFGSALQLPVAPNGNGRSLSGNESQLFTSQMMVVPSPRVTVSMWDHNEENLIHDVDGSIPTDFKTSKNDDSGVSSDDISIGTAIGTTNSMAPIERDDQGEWLASSTPGHRGLAPEVRSSAQTPTINQLAKHHQSKERLSSVSTWLSEAAGAGNDQNSSPQVIPGSLDEDDSLHDDEVTLGHQTENKPVSGQVYLNTQISGDGVTQVDLDIMRQSRNWYDAPLIHSISEPHSTRYQPESSQAAIQKFERMCRDNDSVLSRAATWGTRRRSMPSLADEEGVISGNLFKKLTMKNDNTPHRRPSIRGMVSGLVKRQSSNQALKRKGSGSQAAVPDGLVATDRRESRESLSPMRQGYGWSRHQKAKPSLNTALAGMAIGAASIGTSQARRDSISPVPRATAAPKSPLGLSSVRNSLRRPRSKTELPKQSDEMFSHPNLVGMLKRQGGLPVAQLARSHPAGSEDEDDDDEPLDDEELCVPMNEIDDIEPTPEGFKDHVRRLNPHLHHDSFLVDRIAYQLEARYKSLLNLKIKHLKAVKSQNCHCGPLCMEGGGSSRLLDTRGLDHFVERPTCSSDESAPLEGMISSESFPAGIPVPPTKTLPARVECQLCFHPKKIQKPSDWTKHVHEDIQPFTCTWERCRDPKIFKRKADWVRHENEGHRHLEWWVCDVEDCQHECFRRDNFLQHLVREHKFLEPKLKSKAAVKKAGGGDQTWQKVEHCHAETTNRPQDEPCRFCGKTFASWKKLTVHLAKHMEYICLPVVGLVNKRILQEDTVISPARDPPRRSFDSSPTPTDKGPGKFYSGRPHARSNPNPGEFRNHISGALNTHGIPNMSLPFSSYAQQQQVSYNAMPRGQGQDFLLPIMPEVYQQSYSNIPNMTVSSFTQPISAQVQMAPAEPFPLFDPFRTQDMDNVQMSMGPMIDLDLQATPCYSAQGSVSPFSQSPQPRRSSFLGS